VGRWYGAAVPGSEKVVVNFDGGSRGNPGPAAIAAVATDPSGKVLGERSERIGEATNNVAEYRAVLLGIELAKELGAGALELVGDSKLVVEQVRGNWKVKQEHLRPLHEEVTKALGSHGNWSIRHVRREKNERADELLNEALDA
jgi:ribonuclease HI